MDSRYDVSIVPCYLGFIIFPWLYGSMLHTSTSVSWFQWILRCMFPWFNIYLCFCGSMLPWFHVFRVPCYQDPIIVCFQSSMLAWFYGSMFTLVFGSTSFLFFCLMRLPVQFYTVYHTVVNTIVLSFWYVVLCFFVLCYHDFPVMFCGYVNIISGISIVQWFYVSLDRLVHFALVSIHVICSWLYFRNFIFY